MPSPGSGLSAPTAPPGGADGAVTGQTVASGWREKLPAAPGPLAQLSRGWRVPSAIWVGFEALFGALSVALAHHAGKPVTFDLGNYEYYSGFAELHGFAGPLALPGQLQTYLDPQLNSLYYLLIAHLRPSFAVASIALLQSLPASALAVLVWRLASGLATSRIVPLAAGLIAGTGAFLAPTYAIELGETSSDVVLTLPLVLAAALLYRVVTTSGGRRAGVRDAALAGLLLGIAGGLKFTTGPFVVAEIVAFLAALLVARPMSGWTYRRCLLLLGTPVVIGLLVTLGLYLPEALLLWHRYHDPLFPYFNGIFHSQYLQPGNYRDGRWPARTPLALWHHFSRLLIGGENHRNGMSQWNVRSPLLFFSLVASAMLLVVDLVRRKRPGAIFLEVSLLSGFVLWAVVFGAYRYVAPLELTAAGVVVVLFLLRLRESLRPSVLAQGAVLMLLAGALGAGTVFATASKLGIRETFGTTYFAIRPGAFADLADDGVVLAGPGPLGYLVPSLPANAQIVRAGGDLEQVMAPAWWSHVRSSVRHSRRTWQVIYLDGTVNTVPDALRQIGFSRAVGRCHTVGTAVIGVQVCPVRVARTTR